MKKSIFTLVVAALLALSTTSCKKCTNCTLTSSGVTTYTYDEACGDEAISEMEDQCISAAGYGTITGTPTTCTCVEK